MAQGIPRFYLHAGAYPRVGGAAQQLGYEQGDGKQSCMHQVAVDYSGGNIYHLLGGVDEGKCKGHSQNAGEATQQNASALSGGYFPDVLQFLCLHNFPLLRHSGCYQLLYEFFRIAACLLFGHFVVIRKHLYNLVCIKLLIPYFRPQPGGGRIQVEDVAEIDVRCAVLHDDAFVGNLVEE